MSTLLFRDMPSSPPPTIPSTSTAGSGKKVKRPPPVTPKRFTKFFTPRSASVATIESLSHSARQLRDITHSNDYNRGSSVLPSTPKSVQNWFSVDEDENDDATVFGSPSRNRKRTYPITPPDSSPCRMSPTKRMRPLRFDRSSVIAEEEEEEADYDADSAIRMPLPSIDLSYFLPPCRLIDKLNYTSTSISLLERSFGLSTRPHIGYSRDIGQAACSGFYSGSNDMYEFPRKSVPFCVATAHHSRIAAIGDEEGGIRLFDTSNFSAPSSEFAAHENALVDLAFSSDDSLLATASGDHTCTVIDVNTQQTKYIMAGHLASVKQIRFQPTDSNILASSSRDGSIRIWDVRCSGSEVGSLHMGPLIDHSSRTSSLPRYTATSNTILHSHAVLPSLLKTLSTKAETAAQRRSDASITALTFLDPSRPHFLLSGSETSTSLRLWDIRARYSRHRECLPISSTQEPAWHGRHRPFGVNSVVMGSGGGAPNSRVYALSRDSTVYVYSTNHIILGHAPQLERDIEPKYRITSADSKVGLAPIYGLRHPELHASSFFVKTAIRPPTSWSPEILAVGNSDGFPVLFNTDESACKSAPVSASTAPPPMAATRRASSVASVITSQPGTPFTHRFPPISSFAAPLSSPTQCSPGLQFGFGGAPYSTLSRSSDEGTIPTYDTGVPLRYGYKLEVSALDWDIDGRLVTIGDDVHARVWNNDPVQADTIRRVPVGHPSRFEVGVAMPCTDNESNEDPFGVQLEEDSIIDPQSVDWW